MDVWWKGGWHFSVSGGEGKVQEECQESLTCVSWSVRLACEYNTRAFSLEGLEEAGGLEESPQQGRETGWIGISTIWQQKHA